MNIEKLNFEDYNEIIDVWEKSGLSVRLNGREKKENMKIQFSKDNFSMFGIKDDM